MAEKKKMGRPPKYDIAPLKVEQLASFGCTNTEIASFFNVKEHVIRKTYAENLTKGRESGKMRLRQAQWNRALVGKDKDGNWLNNGNVTMLIWLGKQMLGQTEKTELQWENPIDGVEFIDV